MLKLFNNFQKQLMAFVQNLCSDYTESFMHIHRTSQSITLYFRSNVRIDLLNSLIAFSPIDFKKTMFHLLLLCCSL